MLARLAPRRTEIARVAVDVELHADALVQRLGQLEHPLPQVGGHPVGDRPVQHRLRPVHGAQGAERREPARSSSRASLLELGLVEQAPAVVGVVVGPVEALLEAPVEEVLGARALLHGLELLEGGVHALVREQRPLPVALQGQEALGEGVGVAAVR